MALFLYALLILVADQFTKTWIRSNLNVGQSLFEAGFFRLTHVRNTGAAFGLFRDQTFILTIVAVISLAVILLYVFFIYRRFPLLSAPLGELALGLVFGGTVGNLIDRLRFGYVTDFLDFGLWPAFNMADSAITVGIIMVVYSILRLARAGKH